MLLSVCTQVEAVIESEETKACVKVYQELITTEKEYITDLNHAISVSGEKLVARIAWVGLTHTILT